MAVELRRGDADAVRKIAFVRRSSAFSFSNWRILAASAVLTPGRYPVSISTCFTHPLEAKISKAER